MLNRMTRRLSWLVLATIVLTGCAIPRVAFPTATPTETLDIPGEMYRPDGPGPFPAVVLLHGCEGVSPNTRRWARWLRDRRYVALVVDSWTPRGFRETCSFSGPEPANTLRLDDTVGALRYLHTQRDVDARRIGVMGWSNGGVYAMAIVNGPSLARAAARGVMVPEPGFAAAVAIYPGGCSSLVAERVVRPLLVLVGEADDWIPASHCIAMVSAMRAKGADATIHVFPGAYHYFDFEGLARTELRDVGNDTRPGGCCGATVAYNAAAFAAARRRVAEFLGYHLPAR